MRNSWKRFRNSTFGKSFRIFSRRDRRKIIVLVAIQIAVGLMDLLGVALIGVIGALAVTGIQSGAPGDRVSKVLQFLELDSYTFQTQTIVLGSLATAILVARTFISVILTRKALFFVSRRSAVVSQKIVNDLFAQDLPSLQKFPIQQTMYSISNGINAITLGVVGNTVNLVSDIALLVIMTSGLFIFDTQIAIFSVVFFGSVAAILYKLMQSQAQILGQKEAEISILTNQLLFESLNSYREIYVKGLRKSYAERISRNQFELSSIVARMSFLPSVSKYVIESSIIVGALLVSAFQFMQYDAERSIATLAVFLAAGTRISPAVLRVQQGLISIKNSLGGAQTTLKLIGQLQPNSLPMIDSCPRFDHQNFIPEVILKNVKFNYGGIGPFQMGPINLRIEPGTVVAIVGASGSGKTTLADLVLGAIHPTSGSVEISGKAPSDIIAMHPGAIAYVPQDIQIFKGDVIANIAFGYEYNESSLTAIHTSLHTAHLSEVISNLPNGLQTELGDKGFRLSGGQRQRLGIARALFTSPKLIVLDEATSALDGKTEDEISTAISKLKGGTTVILIAHRLASVRDADSVIYMADGKVVAQGTFEEIRSAVPDFAQQAKLMGL